MSKLGWGLAITGAAGLLYFAKKQLDLLKGYSWKIKRITTGEITKDKMEIDLDIEFANKSSIGFTLTGYEFDVYLNNIFVAKVKTQLTQHVAPKSSAQLKIPVFASPKDVLKKDNISLIAALLNPKALRLKFQGVVSVKAGFINAANIPVTLDDTLGNITKPKEAV